MKIFEKAVNIIVEDVKNDLNDYYKDWEINTWSEYVQATGRDSKAVKEDVAYILTREELCVNDYCELQTEDYDYIPYVKLMNAVRKQLKVEKYLK